MEPVMYKHPCRKVEGPGWEVFALCAELEDAWNALVMRRLREEHQRLEAEMRVPSSQLKAYVDKRVEG